MPLLSMDKTSLHNPHMCMSCEHNRISPGHLAILSVGRTPPTFFIKCASCEHNTISPWHLAILLGRQNQSNPAAFILNHRVVRVTDQVAASQACRVMSRRQAQNLNSSRHADVLNLLQARSAFHGKTPGTNLYCTISDTKLNLFTSSTNLIF